MDDNKKKDPASLVDSWLEEIMKKMDLPEDGNPADAADPLVDLPASMPPIESSTPVDDEEVDRIVQETLAEDWGSEPAQNDTDPTRFFPKQDPQDQDAPQEEPDKAPEDTPTEPADDTDESSDNNDLTDDDDGTTDSDGDTDDHDGGSDDDDDADDDFFGDEDSDPSAGNSDDHKGRPKGKKGYGLFGIPHIISTFIWLVLIVAIGVSLGRTVWLCAADLLALGKTGQAVSITIEAKDQMPDIAKKLQDAGMIQYPKLFETFAKLTGKGNNLLVGKIDFSEKMVYDYNALINAMSYRGGARVTVEVMIPEGYNCAQTFELLEEKGVCSASALERYAANGELESYWFLDGVERGHKYCLEGFLFPDTYEFYLNDDAGRVIHKLLNGFEARFSNRMIDKFVALNQKTGLNLTLRDVITMASIVEKEKASDPEGYDIASVFYNRLQNPGNYPFLQSDATIKYDVDYRSKGELITDSQINASPYNTYTSKGLPPGPISNPGLASLDAALDPNDTSYYFFIYDKDAGVHRFSKTYSEHTAWARKLGMS